MSNTFGQKFTLTTFGESHGAAIGGIVDGMPAGIPIDLDELARMMSRRKPGQSDIVTARSEADKVEILSGVFEGLSTGTPIGFIIRNTNQHSADYENMRHLFRPSHADLTYAVKYGIRDHRGGGRSSARETAARVAGGALAIQALKSAGISVNACTTAVGDISIDPDPELIDFDAAERNAVRCPDPAAAAAMENLIREVKREGDTIGGVVTCVVKGCPAGLGEPVFDRLGARLAAAMMSINAAKGFDYGMGFSGVSKRGSQVIDTLVPGDAPLSPRFLSNHSGGIQGGISTGQTIYMRVAFKPVATLLREIATVDDQGNATTLLARGRHDPCVVPRAVPVVEAMAAMTILDALLLNSHFGR